MHVEDINVQSRYGSGVRVMRLGEGDRVVTVARTEHSDEEETAKPEDDGAEEEPVSYTHLGPHGRTERNDGHVQAGP